jgi:hypothetical protein
LEFNVSGVLYTEQIDTERINTLVILDNKAQAAWILIKLILMFVRQS